MLAQLTPFRPGFLSRAAAGKAAPEVVISKPSVGPLSVPPDTVKPTHTMEDAEFKTLLADFGSRDDLFAKVVAGKESPLRDEIAKLQMARGQLAKPRSLVKTLGESLAAEHILPKALNDFLALSVPTAAGAIFGSLLISTMAMDFSDPRSWMLGEFLLSGLFSSVFYFCNMFTMALLEDNKPDPPLQFSISAVLISFFGIQLALSQSAGMMVLAALALSVPLFVGARTFLKIIPSLRQSLKERNLSLFGVLAAQRGYDDEIAQLNRLKEPKEVERSLARFPELQKRFVTSVGLAASPQAAAVSDLFHLIQLQRDGLAHCFKSTERVQTLAKRFKETPTPGVASTRLEGLHSALGETLTDLETSLKKTHDKLEHPDETQKDFLEALPGELLRIEAELTALDESLSTYREAIAIAEKLSNDFTQLKEETVRAKSEFETLAAYPFKNETYRKNRDATAEDFFELQEQMDRAESNVIDFLNTDGGSEKSAREALAAARISLAEIAKHAEAMRTVITAEKEKLRARFEALLAHPIPVTLHSLPVAAVKKALTENLPNIPFYDAYYDDEEEAEKYIPRAVTTLDLRTVLRVIGALNRVLFAETRTIENPSEESLQNPMSAFRRMSVFAKVSADATRLSQEITKAFIADSSLIASEEFQEMPREAQIPIIREALQGLIEAGDAENLVRFFTDLETYAAPMAKAFWLIDAHQNFGDEAGTLIGDLRALKQDPKNPLHDAVGAFWQRYLVQNGYLRNATI